MADALQKHFVMQVICLNGSLMLSLCLAAAQHVSPFGISLFIALFSLFISITALFARMTKFQQKFIEQRWIQTLAFQLSWPIQWHHIEYTLCTVVSSMHLMGFLLNWTIAVSVGSGFVYYLSSVVSLMLSVMFALTALEAVKNGVADSEEDELQSDFHTIYQEF